MYDPNSPAQPSSAIGRIAKLIGRNINQGLTSIGQVVEDSRTKPADIKPSTEAARTIDMLHRDPSTIIPGALQSAPQSAQTLPATSREVLGTGQAPRIEVVVDPSKPWTQQ